MTKQIDKTPFYILFFICFLDLFILFYCVSNLSISYDEAKIFYVENSLLSYIVRFSCKIFGQNDYALRLPFLIFNFLSLILFYKISKHILKRKNDRYVCVILFIFLPGILASAILVNEAGLVLLLTIFMIYLYQNNFLKSFYISMFICAFLSNSFMLFYVCVLMFGIYIKHRRISFLALFCFIVSISFFGFEIDGKPKGYLLDTIGIFAAVFSPFLFLYFIYTIYRIAIKEEDKNIVWFVSAGSFVICALFSIRQKLYLEDFLPFSIIVLPLMVRVFFNSYRARLPQFRVKYKIFTTFVLFSLLFFSMLIVLNPILYAISFKDNPQKHFAYNYHIAKELSIFLKQNNFNNLYIKDKKMALRLQFYGINNDKKSNIFLEEQKYTSKNGEIISKFKLYKVNTLISQYNVIKEK
ncbi:ArnT family glycosyltransferase [Campylobacter sputorum]|uniref:ArnT family glycosyltransferase n=1 Tax=Campylobacter sputorum TaxID=206 RepID=UPI001E512DE8|nr:glycosyltransferase family 39 protein [Campylobacter sputorum]